MNSLLRCALSGCTMCIGLSMPLTPVHASTPVIDATVVVAEPQGSPTKPLSIEPLILPRKADGNGSVAISGELRLWHKVTLTLDGPYTHERDNRPNPFTDYRMIVTFTHADGTTYIVPGYFSADGDAGNTSAESGTKWRAHFAPDRTGQWSYKVAFHQGELATLDDKATARAVNPFYHCR